MPIIPERSGGLFVRDDDEDLFSRDINGQLVRLDAPTQGDYEKQVTLQIDGQSITVFLAEPLKDANGNVVQDLDGQTTPRYTTIYDAATKLYGNEAKIPIPTLCHLPHMKPVAVCRLCVVQIYGQKHGKRAAERKLLPACQHPVKDGMEVFTMNAPGPDGDRVRQSVKVVTEVLAAAELLCDPVFAGIPPKFLLWQQGLVIRRQLRRGRVLCRKGEPGNTAFIIKSGRLEALVILERVRASRGVGGMFRSFQPFVYRAQLTPENLIAGEMACVSGSPRVADLRVVENAEVWELRRNVLDRLMRLPRCRAKFEQEYRDRSLKRSLQGIELFRDLAQEEYENITDYLRARISFLRVTPGQVLFHQDELANEAYLIRLGHIRVGVKRYGSELRVLTKGPGTIFGEIGLLALSARDALKSIDQVDRKIAAELNSGADIPTGVRTATVSALNHLELARVGRADFIEMLRRFPVLRRRTVEQSLRSLRSDSEVNPLMAEYVEQGLYEGQSILVLDMDLCTRCDECTKGCIREHGDESHGVPITRLLRDGRPFGDYLVAVSCRSCTDPHCMSGCPVDSIHRGKHLQIVIEDHCIGCGLCASNCPYGNIFMVPNLRRQIEMPDPEHVGRTHVVGQLKAANCDLCDAMGELSSPRPACVAACPHDAAFRVTGPQLLERVMGTHVRDLAAGGVR